jgi:2-keto-4-pentenoate hydratase/2-oxohepta-3-ene-1,7-dioic acid hydratase in catechol pathway
VSNNKIVAIGKNYAAHAAEMGLDLPAEPLMFIKPNTALLPHLGEIVIPPVSRQVDYEAELAVVIGKTAKNVCAAEADGYIFGYTCANDVTARDLQAKDGQWTRAKSFDTFLPVGPYIVKGVDPSNLDIKLTLNGEVKQHSNTNSFIFSVGEIIEAVTKVMTLYPGDLILTGTPAGIGPVKPGDEVAVEIENVGRLVNRVK